MKRRAWLFAVFLFAVCSLSAMPAQPPSKPLLLIVHSQSCGPCLAFDRCMIRDRAFADTIRNHFDCRILRWEIAAEQATARRLKVKLLPAFVVTIGDAAADPIHGFEDSMQGRNELLRQLRQAVASLEVVPPSSPVKPVDRKTEEQSRDTVTPRDADAAAPPLVDAVARKQIDELTKHNSQLRDQLSSLNSAVNQSVSQTRELVATQKQTAESLTHSIDRTISDRVGKLSTEFMSRVPPTTATSSPVVAASGGSMLGDLLSGGISTALVAAGVASPIAGVAGLIAVKLLRRRAAKRIQSAGPAIVPTEERRTTENHYVVKETDKVGEAYKEAIRRTVAAFKSDKPGIVDVATQIEHVAGEVLRGQNVMARESKTQRPGIWSDNEG